MEGNEIIGLIAGSCTASALVPQIVTTVKKKKAGDTSLFMFIVMLTGNALWVCYGIAQQQLPVMLTNIVSFSLNVVMLVLKYKYA